MNKVLLSLPLPNMKSEAQRLNNSLGSHSCGVLDTFKAEAVRFQFPHFSPCTNNVLPILKVKGLEKYQGAIVALKQTGFQ